MNTLIQFILVLLAGLAGGFVIHYWSAKKSKSNSQIQKEASTVLQRIEHVLKIVVTEGYFAEIYDYRNTKFGSTKKALVKVNAKVLIGFDAAKLKVTKYLDEKRIVIDQLPPAEIMAVDSEYKYYDIDNGLWNKFNESDLSKLLQDAKVTIVEQVTNSQLLPSASKQLENIINETTKSLLWTIQLPSHNLNSSSIDEGRLLK